MEYIAVLLAGCLVAGVCFLIAKQYRRNFRCGGGKEPIGAKRKEELTWPAQEPEAQQAPERTAAAEQQECGEEDSRADAPDRSGDTEPSGEEK